MGYVTILYFKWNDKCLYFTMLWVYYLCLETISIENLVLELVFGKKLKLVCVLGERKIKNSQFL